MKKKVIIVINVILILIALKLVYNYMINKILISKYNNNEYKEFYARALTLVNFPQSYVANYNYGNILYKKEMYEDAMSKYEKALNGNVPKNKECCIRINYALAICKTVQVDENDNESINDAIKTYQSAIDVLTENGCANKEDNNGHSEKAEQLKSDIQSEIERLKALKDPSDDDNGDDKDKDKDKDNNKDETVEEKIQKIKQQAIQEQRKIENRYKNYKNYDFNKTGKNW